MTVYRFRVSVDTDDHIYRDIDIKSTQSLKDFNNAILRSFEIDKNAKSAFFSCKENFTKKKELISFGNAKAREAISENNLLPLSKLVNNPNQKFLYECYYKQTWLFYIELTKITELSKSAKGMYPICVNAEGLSPVLVPDTNDQSRENFDDLRIDKDDFEDDFEDFSNYEEYY